MMKEDPDPTPAASGHERGKARRRLLILETALKIISEEGADALTIRAIAARAGLSPVTVLNLYGSKHGILKAIYEDDYHDIVAYFEKHASKNEFTRIFDLIDLSTEYFLLKLDFYRDLFRTLVRTSDTEVAVKNWAVRMVDLHRLLTSAVAAGYLVEDTPVDVLTSILVRLGKAVTQEWVDNSLTPEQSRLELGLSFGVVLQHYVADKGQKALARVRKRYEQATGKVVNAPQPESPIVPGRRERARRAQTRKP